MAVVEPVPVRIQVTRRARVLVRQARALRPKRQTLQRLWIALIVLGASVVVVGLVFLVIVVPPAAIQASRPDIRRASAADQLKAENDLRGTLVTVLAGVAVSAGTAVAVLSFNLQRRGQVTERFSRAIDQLGARGEGQCEKLDVRLGGIYSLEQIARDSPELHWPIVEILIASIREHSQSTVHDDSVRASAVGVPTSATSATTTSRREQTGRDQESMSSRKVAADIQAALTVLGRREGNCQ